MEISGTSTDSRWERLGALLIQRRTQLSPRFHNRGAFCEATGLKYRLIYDVEEARRSNFGTATLSAIETAYKLAPGAIPKFLAGSELETADNAQERPVRTRVNRSMARTDDLIPVIHDIAEELAAGKKPSKSEQLIWDSRLSDEEKWNLIAQLRQADANPASAAETGLASLLATASSGSPTAG